MKTLFNPDKNPLVLHFPVNENTAQYIVGFAYGLACNTKTSLHLMWTGLYIKKAVIPRIVYSTPDGLACNTKNSLQYTW